MKKFFFLVFKIKKDHIPVKENLLFILKRSRVKIFEFSSNRSNEIKTTKKLFIIFHFSMSKKVYNI